MKIRLLVFALLVAMVVVGCGSKTTTPAAPSATNAPQTEQAAVWTCPMHPDVKEPKPGKCPKCGMDLVQAKKAEDKK